MTLWSSLVFRFVLTAVAPLLMFGIITFRFFGEQTLENVYAQNLILAQSARNNIQDRLHRPLIALNDLALRWKTLPGPGGMKHLHEEGILKAGLFESVYRVSKGGVIIDAGLSPEDADKQGDLIGLDVSRQPFFTAIKATRSAVWSDTFRSLLSGQQSVALAFPVSEGFLIGTMGIAKLQELLGEFQHGPDIITFMVDSRGTAMFHPDSSLVDQKLNLLHLRVVREGLEGIEGTIPFTWMQADFVGSVTRVKETGWIVVVARSLDSALEPVNAIKRSLAAAAMGGLLLAVIVAQFLARGLARPLARFAEKANEIGRGKYESPLPPLRYPELSGVASAIQDMAEGIQARERQLRELQKDTVRELDFRQVLMDSISTPVYFKDLEGRYLGCNEAFEAVMGRQRDWIIGRTIVELQPEEIAAPLQQSDATVIGTGEPQAFEATVRYSDGSTRKVLFHKTLFRDPSGSRGGIIGVFIDISDRKRMESALKWELTVSQALTDMSTILIGHTATIQEAAGMTLKYARAITESEHGFVSTIDPRTGAHHGHALTGMMGSACKVPEQDRAVVFPRGPDGRYPGLWGVSLNERRNFFSNSPETHEAWKGLPEGHIPLSRFISVPVIVGGELVGQVALANAARDYGERDVDALQRMALHFGLAVQRMRMEEQIRASLDEKVVLLREIHHRVKNNFQVISSLLRLQSRHVRDPDMKQVFLESEKRIQSMAIVHEKLYDAQNISAVDACDYLSTLATDLFQTYRTSSRVSLSLDIEPVPLSVETAVSCGLAVNELVSNALKYAYADGQAGEVFVGLRRLNGGPGCELVVRDDGIGIPESIDPEHPETLGLQLVRTVVGHQLRGTLVLDRKRGTDFRVRFTPSGAEMKS